MPEIKLRPYQEVFIDNIRQAMREHKHLIACGQTGMGKTVCFSAIAQMSLKKTKKVLVVSYRTEVVGQNGRSIDRFVDGEVKYITPRVKNVPEGLIFSAMAQTLYRRKDKPEWRDFLASIDLLIIDEAHDANMNFLFDYISPKCFVVGFTATPVRYGNQRQLGLDYGTIVKGPSVKELISLGFLCRCKMFGLEAPKMENVEWSPDRGDYSLAQMAAKFKSNARYVGVVDNWERICKGTKTIVFCCSSEQTIGICKEFCERGYRAKYVLSGSFDDDEDYSGDRKDIISGFTNNEFDILVNYGIATTGLDVPDIKTVILDFSTTSLTKYLQCLGRGSRPHPTKNGEFICLDFGGNINELGMYDADREWYLFHNKSKPGPAPMKECPEDKGGCGRLIPIQNQTCPFCGYVFPTQEQIYHAYLEEVKQSNADDSPASYAARKKQEGWGFQRIAVQLYLRNTEQPKKAFIEGYLAVFPDKTTSDAEKYWFVWNKNIGKKLKAGQK